MENKAKLFQSVAIVGGGIGGLTLAHLLHDSGTEVTVYERDVDEKSREQGYYIGLNKLGLPSLKKIVDRVPGLNEMLHEASSGSSFFIVNSALSELMMVGGLSLDDTTLVSRWGLREILTQGLTVKYNKRFIKYEEHPDHVEIFFEDGTSAKADLLIGADGAQSLIRKQRCTEIVNENLNLINVGGTISVDAVKVDHIAKYATKGLLRALGENGRSLLTFEFKPANNNTPTFLWAISWPHPPGHEMKDIFGCDMQSTDRSTFMKAVHEKIVQEAQQNFSNPDVATLLRSTPTEELMEPRHIYSSKPRKVRPWPKTTRVLLLGDAVHPMTTHAGLGANTALADARELADALKKQTWPALEAYEVELFKRGANSVTSSLTSTNMIHTAGYFKQKFRNTFIWLIGSIMSLARFFRRK